jgi:hypothetical protein
VHSKGCEGSKALLKRKRGLKGALEKEARAQRRAGKEGSEGSKARSKRKRGLKGALEKRKEGSEGSKAF